MIRSILVIRLSALGDVANMLPVLTALRRSFPEARMDYVVEDRHEDLVRDHPCLDDVIVFPRRRWKRMMRRPWMWPRLAAEAIQYVQRLRRERYDAVLEMQGNLKGALHAVAARSRRRIGYARGFCYESAHMFATVRVRPPGKRIPRVEKYMALVRALDPNARIGPPTMAAPRAAVDDIRAYLEACGLKPGAYVVVHAGTSEFGREKRWAPERFSALCERIHREFGLPCVIAWGHDERALAELICHEARAAAVLGPETRTVPHLVELIRSARLFIGADSGPLHVAAASGRTCVGLYGTKDPAIYAPYPRERHVVVQSPTGRMEDLSVDAAIEGVRAAFRMDGAP